MKKLLMFSITCILISCTYSQDRKHGIEYPIDVKNYINQDKVTWYGWDFSHFKITDHNAYGYVVKTYIPKWVKKLNNYFPESQICRKLNKGNCSADLTSIQNLYQNVDEKSLEAQTLFELSVDSIKEIVKQYTLPQKEGAGFVIIVETMNRPQRFVTAYITFFDISTRELYWTTKMKGLPGGKHGVEQYYRNGMIEVYKYFFSKYYNKRIRQTLE
jgi:hypothetical protein